MQQKNKTGTRSRPQNKTIKNQTSGEDTNAAANQGGSAIDLTADETAMELQ